MKTSRLIAPAVLACLCFASYAAGQTPVFAHPHARILQNIDESATVRLHGNTHPLIATASASKPADDSTPMEHMILFLKADTTQESQLAQLIAQQNDPKSPLYHHFMTSKDFGTQFGVAQSDMEKVTDWLQNHGFTVEELPPGNRAVVFSGTASQVAETFKTEIRQYRVGGATHFANASDPQIPAALADTVGGVVKLHDFRYGRKLTNVVPVSTAQLSNPNYTYGSNYYLSPADYGILYDINPLYSAGINGTGQSIAVIARSNIYLTDVQSFRSTFGLKANNPQIVITSTDPGVLEGDSVETTLDTEWSGAVAPNATIKVIVSASTNTADGIDLAALYAVNNNVAPIVSLSYGSCEAEMGSSELAYYNSLWKQAAAQGMSVMVSSGDSGAAGCYGGSSSSGSGQAINGLCSSPYATCVGGTEFVEGSNPGQYWLPGNNPTYGSAISYIPEKVWNESGLDGGSGLWAGGGGASITYAKPAWQTGPGVPADGKRDVPDVSLTASSHDGYLIWLYGSLNSVGGTSAAAPSFAGLMALVDQKTNARQGLANAIFYPLAAKQATGGAAIFHDTKTGNNSVPGVTGFSATTGYDLASGLGSVDANLLVTHWTDAASTASLALSASATSLTVKLGQTVPTTITSTAVALNSAVTLSVAGAPTGLTAVLASNSVASPGSGSVVLNVTASTSVTPGTYSLTVTGTGGGQTAKLTISVIIPAPTFTLSPASGSVNVVAGGTVQVAVATAPQNGFSSTVTLSATGMPTGVTVAFSPTTITGTAGGYSNVAITVARTVKAGSYPITISATGGGITQKSAYTVVVAASASCTLAATPSTVTLIAGQAATLLLSCGSVQGTFTAPLTLALSGTPAGVTAKLAASTMAAGASEALSISSLASTVAGNYTLSVSATSGTYSQTVAIPLTVPKPTFTLSPASGSVSAVLGNTVKVTVATAPQNGFSSAVTLSASGMPTGMTVAFSPTTLTGTTSGSSSVSITVATTVKSGSYPITISATGGGITQKSTFTVVVPVAASCTLAAAPSSVTLIGGQATSVTVSCGSVQSTFTLPLTLSLSGAPTGVTAKLAASTMAAGASEALSISSLSTTAPGSYTLSLTATSGTFTRTLTIPVTVPTPTFTFASSTSSISTMTGGSGQATVTTTPQNGFAPAISLSVATLPSGVTATFSPATLTGTAAGSSTLKFSIASTAKAGTYPLTVTAAGGGVTHTSSLSLAIAIQPICSLTANPTSVSLTAGKSASVQVTCAVTQGSFSTPLALSLSGAPSGVTAQTSATAISAGSATTLNIASTLSTTAGNYNLSLNAAGHSYSQTIAIPVTIAAPSTFTIMAASTAVTINSGATSQVSVTTTQYGTFNSAVSLSLSGVPAGVTGSLSGSVLGAPGRGTVVATFAVSSSAKPGSYPITVTGTGGGQTQTATIMLNIATAQNFTLAVNLSSLTIKQGGAGTVIVSTGNFTGGFNSTITVTFSGLGVGMNWGVIGATTGNNLVNISDSFSAASYTPAGTYPVTITATGAGITHTAVVQMTVTSATTQVKK